MTVSKVLSREALLEAAARQRAAGKTIVFANGAFDLLHVGHVRYLQAAAREGGWLVVGINSDRSVRALKGDGRPVLPESERAEIVSAVDGVDAVVLFDEDSPGGLLRDLKPDVHAKGTDYTVASVPEREIVASYGGRTAIVGDPKEHATTDLLARIRETENGKRDHIRIRLMKILIVRLSSMGDIIHALPLAENAHRGGARVAWLTEPRFAGLLEGNPAIEKIFTADTRKWRRNLFSPAHWREVAALSRELKAFAPDAVLDAQGLWKSALLSRLAGARVVSFSAAVRREPSSAMLVGTGIDLSSDAVHVVDQNLALLAPLGLEVTRRAPDARYLLQRRSLAAEAFLATLPTPFALYHPGAARAEKTWGEEKYAALASRLHEDLGFCPAISWGPGDEPYVARLSALLPSAARLPALDFRGLAQVMALASLFVAGDTGPVHLADAVGAPSLALFGPDSRRRNVPTRNRPYRGFALSYDQTDSVEMVGGKAVELVTRPRMIEDSQ